MKKLRNYLLYLMILTIIHLPEAILGQPDPGDNGGGGPLGGGAPIGGGLGILLALAMGYGVKRWWDARKRHLNE